LPLDFHKNAKPAAVAAKVAFLAKGNEAFWKVNEKIFANQKDLSEENYVKWLAEVGVSKADYDKHKAAAEQKVTASFELSKQLGIQGTPNFLIDGEAVSGAQPLEKFTAIIDAHLKKAQELKGKGTPDTELYAAMVKSYWKQPAAKEEPAEEPEDTSVWKVDIGHSPQKGKKDALVTVVMFSDFQCPFCKRVEPTLSQLEKDYGDKIRFVWKNQPLSFHNRAMPSAIFTWEARKQKGDEGFWKAHDELFLSQPKLEDADFEGIAKKLGLDWAKVQDALKTNKWKEEIQVDIDQAEELKVQGTPHAFVNGRVVNGAQPIEKWKKLVDEELKKAQAKVAAGTPAEKVYEETVKGGKGGPLPPLTVPATAPTKGGKDAKVVIHVFSEFQCPFCKRAEQPMAGPDGKDDPNTGAMKAVAAKYGDKVKIVWRNFPLGFHNRATPAANFAIEAYKQKGADTFWKVHDDLFASQPKLEDADLEAIAKKHGLDWAKCKAAIDTNKYKDEIEADTKAGAEVGVTGTPAFIINGKSLVGAQPPDAFFKAIDGALAKAK